jgi:hypothetical protein
VIIVVLIIGDNAVYYLLSADCDWLAKRATAILQTSTRENRIYITANHASGTTQYTRIYFPFHADFHHCRLSAYCKYIRL